MTLNSKKDYYRILGVQEDADDLVIRASYLALLKRYNLDDWKGDKQQAIKILADINEAYSVLKDRYERLEYNSNRQNSQEEDVELVKSNLSPEEIEAAWQVACNYYDDLDVLYFNLFQISEQVANNFKLSILSSKDYQNRNKLAAKLELDYLKSQFGNDQDLLEFGKELILEEGRQDAVSELHHVVNVMGNAVLAHEVIDKISKKYQTQRFFVNRAKEKAHQDRLAAEESRLLKERQERVDSQLRDIKEREKASGNWGLFWLLILIIIVSSALFLAGKDDSTGTTKKENSVQFGVQSNLSTLDKLAEFENLSLGEFKGFGDGSNISLRIEKRGDEYFAELTTVAMPELRTPAGEPVYCSGGIDGSLSSSNDKHVFFLKKKLHDDVSNNEYCTLKITRLTQADGYAVNEDGCLYFHGWKCVFSSDYLARK